MPATVDVKFKRGDSIKLKDEKVECPKTLRTLLEKNGLTKDHLTSGKIKVISFHVGTLRAQHPVNGRPCLMDARIFEKAD
jgi:hypothetical protein